MSCTFRVGFIAAFVCLWSSINNHASLQLFYVARRRVSEGHLDNWMSITNNDIGLGIQRNLISAPYLVTLTGIIILYFISNLISL
jgi:hypothetical protein